MRGEGRAGRDPSTPRDDHILPIVRAAALLVIVILALASFVLFFHPDQTEQHFAWTIMPKMTALLMGVGYGSAIYFYLRVLTERRWHRVTLGFLPTTLFAWLLLTATILHFGKFHHGTLPFELWFWVYVIFAVLVPGLWLLNRPRDPKTLEERDAWIPAGVRLALAGAGLGLLVVVAVMFGWPSSAIRVWPWTLTPLTARTVAGFTSIPAAGWLAIARDGRWSAARVLCETLAFGLVLLAVSVGRAWSEFDHSRPLTWVYLVWIGATLACIVALYVAMESRARRPQQAPQS